MIVTDPCLCTLHARGSMYEIYAQLKMCANMFACKSKGKCNCKSNYLIPCNDVSSQNLVIYISVVTTMR